MQSETISKTLSKLICTVTVFTIFGFGYATSGNRNSNQVGSYVQQREIECPTHDDTALKSYEGGIMMAEMGKTELAIEFYTAAILMDSGFCDAMDNMGQLYRSSGQLDSAIYWYRRSIAVNPNGFVAHMNLGVALRRQGNLEDAISEYQTCIKIDSSDPEGYFGLGSVLADGGDYATALTALEKAKGLYQNLSSPYLSHVTVYLGMCHANLQEWSIAKECLEAVYDEFQKEPTVSYYLGLCYMSDNPPQLDIAYKYLSKAKKCGSVEAAELLKNWGE